MLNGSQNVSIVRSAQAHDMIVREVQGIPASPVFERMQTDVRFFISIIMSMSDHDVALIDPFWGNFWFDGRY